MRTEQINGRTRIFGIVGDPIAAVRSPEYFNARFARQGQDAVLIPIHVPASDLQAAWRGLKAMRNLEGMVFTMPHKVAAAGLMDELGESAQFVGAVNTARRLPDGRWRGDIFDGLGFVDGLRGRGHEVAGRRAFLMGAGGAGAAIAAALAGSGVSELTVHDRDTARCASLVASLARRFPQVAVRAGVFDAGPGLDLAINASPQGMNDGDALPFDPARLPASAVVADVITKPEITPLIEAARRLGLSTSTGRHMHEGQARRAAAFFGLAPDVAEPGND